VVVAADVAVVAVDAMAAEAAAAVAGVVFMYSAPEEVAAVGAAVQAAAVAAEVPSSEAVAVGVAEAGAAVPAGHGHHSAGCTAAGVSRLLRPKYLPSRRSNPHEQWRSREKVTGISSPHVLNSVPQLQQLLS
jgi:hypothetical protein